MRAGGYTVHQSLTAEAAAVLKLALGLARSRSHAQVTPLHVAFTLLTSSTGSSSSPPCAYGLLRRACDKAHPGAGASSHTAPRCRALDLCFNVALNRLPTTTNAAGGSPLSSQSSSSAGSGGATPFASSSLVLQPSPTLSNALVAALKRAQANQRRGCVELQSQQPPPTTQQQQQPLLMIKVELDQLIVSILDDPSVSRVMREAGFSSAAIKTCLEEESAMLLSLGHSSSALSSGTSAPPVTTVPSEFVLEAHGGGFPAHAGGLVSAALWPAQILMSRHLDAELESPCKEEESRAILEVMSSWRKQGRRRSNPVVVGDSASAAEASVSELMRRLERGAVPADLRGAHVLRLHLSHAHVRLMTRADVDAWEADLRRTVAACTTSTAALVIYVGDMRWAIDDDDDVPPRRHAYSSPAERMAAALARLLGELRASVGRAWLVAAASYETYMRCQRRELDATWALQPVPVPAGAGLSLDLGGASSKDDGKIGRLAQLPLLDPEAKQEDGVAALCVECASNLEREASAARAKAEGTTLALSCFPGWPQADEPQTSHLDDLMDLERKWSRLCRRVHSGHNRPPPARASSTAESGDPAGLCVLSLHLPCHGAGTASEVRHRDAKWTTATDTETSSDGIRSPHGNMDDGKAEVQEEQEQCFDEHEPPPGGDRKRRRAQSARPPSKSRRRLDLNIVCADEEEGGSGDESVPSDLTSDDGECSGGYVSDSQS